MLAVSACGGAEMSDAERAQERVAAKEQAVIDAQAAFDEASAEFCADSASVKSAPTIVTNRKSQDQSMAGILAAHEPTRARDSDFAARQRRQRN